MMRRYVLAVLAGTVVLALLLRVRTLADFDVWGSDTGEYYAITEALVNTGHVSIDYRGWGFGYPYFPGMFLLVGTFQAMTGAELMLSVKLVSPVTSCIGIMLIFLIGTRAFGDERVGLGAAAGLAVIMPHVYPTSHPMPGTVGDMLALLAILSYLMFREDGRFALLLVPVSIALVATHHLSMFFVIVPIVFYIFVREMLARKSDMELLRREIPVLGFMMAITFGYWLGVAGPFREDIMTKFLEGASGAAVIAIGVIGICMLPLLVRLRRRCRWRYHPPMPDLDRTLMLFCTMLAINIGILVGSSLFSVPGTDIHIEAAILPYFIPMTIFSAISLSGIGPVEFSRHGVFVMCWIGLISGTMGFAWLTDNTVLLFYRQVQYLIAPASVLFGYAIVNIWNFTSRGASKNRAILAALLVASLVHAMALTSIPPREAVGGFQEGVTAQEMDAVLWTGDTVPDRDIVATDHRLSSMLFGFTGTDATWDSARETFHGDLATAEPELRSVDSPTGRRPIGYVLITEEMKDGVALEQWETAEPLSKEALDKFGREPFLKLFDNGCSSTYRVWAL